MLSNADLDLVARDASLPGLATLLNPAAFRDLLRATSATSSQAVVTPTYLRYKPGTRCLIAYDVTLGDSKFVVHANAYTRHDWATSAAVRAPDGRGRSIGWPLLVPDRALIVKAFPDDSRLRVLQALPLAVTRLPLLQKLLPNHSALHFASLETLAYKPERRFVGLLRGEGMLAVIKIYADEVFLRARAAAGDWHRSELLQTPRCIGRSRRHRALVLEWIAGDRLLELLGANAVDDQRLHRVGSALAELHHQLRVSRIDRTASERYDVLNAARAIRALLPAVGDRADRLAAKIAHALEHPSAVQAIHGDFYAGQILLDGRRIGILDLDRRTLGDPLSDVGNFVAHLEYAAVDEVISSSLRDTTSGAFVSGYEQAAGSRVASRVDIHAAAGLLRLATRPFRTRAASWADRMVAILDRIDVRLSLASRQFPRDRYTQGDDLHGESTFAGDRELSLPAEVLNPEAAARQFAQVRPWRGRQVAVSAARVIRHKCGRRCVIEYDIELQSGSRADRSTVIGKARQKGADRHTFELAQALWHHGFNPHATDEILVPQPIAIVPSWKMWLQAKVAGILAEHLLGGENSSLVACRAAEVVHKIQRTNLLPANTHTAADELRILHQRLTEIGRERPDWQHRLNLLFDCCARLLAALPARENRPVHRDFHPGQLIIDDTRVHVLDLDLYAAGDPALDVGNFLAHLTEWSLRKLAAPDALQSCEAAMMERFLELESTVDRRRLEAYKLISLARHISISSRYPDRQAFTGRILEYCEGKLAAAVVGASDL